MVFDDPYKSYISLGLCCRFGVKVGIVGGAVYYTSQIGLWGDSSKTEQLYKDIYKVSAPYIKQTAVEVRFCKFVLIIFIKLNN